MRPHEDGNYDMEPKIPEGEPVYMVASELFDFEQNDRPDEIYAFKVVRASRYDALATRARELQSVIRALHGKGCICVYCEDSAAETACELCLCKPCICHLKGTPGAEIGSQDPMQAPAGPIRVTEPWICSSCGQKNAGWSTRCGRCEDAACDCAGPVGPAGEHEPHCSTSDRAGKQGD